jgi:hypothetical protein
VIVGRRWAVRHGHFIIMWGRRYECLLLQQLLLLLIVERGCHCLPAMVEMLKET